MSTDRLEVSVTYAAERGYIGSVPGLRQPVAALSLAGLRRKVEALLLPDDVRVVQLDGRAERERHRRRAQAQLSRIAQLDQRTTLPDQCLHSAEANVRPPRRKSEFDPGFAQPRPQAVIGRTEIPQRSEPLT